LRVRRVDERRGPRIELEARSAIRCWPRIVLGLPKSRGAGYGGGVLIRDGHHPIDFVVVRNRAFYRRPGRLLRIGALRRLFWDFGFGRASGVVGLGRRFEADGVFR
jgi:hypothetical protein